METIKVNVAEGSFLFRVVEENSHVDLDPAPLLLWCGIFKIGSPISRKWNRWPRVMVEAQVHEKLRSQAPDEKINYETEVEIVAEENMNGGDCSSNATTQKQNSWPARIGGLDGLDTFDNGPIGRRWIPKVA
ncbi:hypothetical protein Ancab_029571 [Ancistrocladus abbreviatus]